jgi:hypothetical protein
MVNLERTIRRAGALLQQLVFVWREKSLTEDINTIEVTETRIRVRHKQFTPERYYQFPEQLVNNEADKLMVLTAGMCSEFLAYFESVVGEMLKGESR